MLWKDKINNWIQTYPKNIKKSKLSKMTSLEYVGGQEASRILGVHQRTLYIWEDKKLIDTIRTPCGKRMYNVNKYINNNKDHLKINVNNENINNKHNICYIRVSSISQKDDLKRQRQVMLKKYPRYEIIEDIGYVLNLNKRGIKKIIKLGIEGKINELVIAYKDRLTRFGYELIEEIIKEYSKGKIIVINETKK